METSDIISLSFLCFAGACCIIMALANLWSLLDHSKWTKHSSPNKDAFIVDVKTELVQYIKNGAKYKTTVYFSDGFVYTTHQTNREDNAFSYRISMDARLSKSILNDAVEAHNRAVRRKSIFKIHKETSKYEYPSTTTLDDPFSVYYSNKKPRSYSPKQKEKKTIQFPNWAMWLLEPHHIVAVVCTIASILLNIFIQKEHAYYLASSVAVFFVEYFLMGVFRAIRNIDPPLRAMIPFFILMIVPFGFPSSSGLDWFDVVGRISPFMATISLTIFVKHIYEHW